MNTNSIPELLISEPSHHVFVYGTLKKNYGNHPIMHGLTPSVFLGVKTTAADTWGLWSPARRAIPFVYNKPVGGSKIEGEHWLVDDVAMSNIRYLEGGYDEEVVELEDGYMATIYTYKAAYLPLGNLSGVDFSPQDGKISWPIPVTDYEEEAYNDWY